MELSLSAMFKDIHSNWHSKLGSESEPLGQPLHLGTGQGWAVLQCSCTEKVGVHLAIWRWPGVRILLSAAGYSDQSHHSKPTGQITAIIAADFIQSKSPGARRKVRCPTHATSRLYGNQLQSEGNSTQRGSNQSQWYLCKTHAGGV